MRGVREGRLGDAYLSWKDPLNILLAVMQHYTVFYEVRVYSEYFRADNH